MSTLQEWQEWMKTAPLGPDRETVERLLVDWQTDQQWLIKELNLLLFMGANDERERSRY